MTAIIQVTIIAYLHYCSRFPGSPSISPFTLPFLPQFNKQNNDFKQKSECVTLSSALKYSAVPWVPLDLKSQTKRPSWCHRACPLLLASVSHLARMTPFSPCDDHTWPSHLSPHEPCFLSCTCVPWHVFLPSFLTSVPQKPAALRVPLPWQLYVIA